MKKIETHHKKTVKIFYYVEASKILGVPRSVKLKKKISNMGFYIINRILITNTLLNKTIDR